MSKYIFKDRKGRFSRPRLNGRVFNEKGREIFGAAKKVVVRKNQKSKRASRTSKGQKSMGGTISSRKVSIKSRAILSSAVPQNLSRSFAWFCENLNNLPDSSTRPMYAILRLEMKSQYREGNYFEVDDLIPIRLPVMTAKKARRLTADEVKEIARLKGIDRVKAVVSIVAKKKMPDIRRNARNNPLIERRVVAKSWSQYDAEKANSKKRRRL